MMNNATSINQNPLGTNTSLQDMISHQQRFEEFHQAETESCSGFIQTPIPDKEYSPLRMPVFSNPNFTSARVGKNLRWKNLRGSLDAYVKTCERWGLEPDKQMILLGYESYDSIGRHVLSGNYIPLSQDFRDRIAYVLRISLGLGSVFNEVVNAELYWLNKIRAELNEKSAFDYMLEGHMLNLLIVLDLVENERGL